MKIKDWLEQNTDKLKKAGVGTARLDCLVLLEDSLGKDRAQLLAHPEIIIEKSILKKLGEQIKQRAKHIPLAQIRGKTEFYGREFIITQDVLEPRPESETMITLLKNLLNNKSLVCKDTPCKIVDVGTGSGALAITARLELPQAEVFATDIDPECLKVAHLNAKKHKVNIRFLQGDLLEPLKIYHSVHDGELSDIFLANLPYVPDHYEINQAALNEPKVAIFGGKDGLDLYRRMFASLKGQPGFIFTESLPFQHAELQKIAEQKGFKLIKTDDFIQVFAPR